jgi:hypothetical protein
VQTIADQAFRRQRLEILDIRAENDRPGIANVDRQCLAVVGAELPDGRPAVNELIGAMVGACSPSEVDEVTGSSMTFLLGCGMFVLLLQRQFASRTSDSS